MKNINRNISEVQSKVDSSIWLKYIIPSTVILLSIIYYFPFYGMDKLIKDTMWAGIYDVINPIVVAPFILGVVSLLINTINNSILFKILFVLAYLMSFILSLIGLMGAIYMRDLLFYTPHIVIIVLHIVIWIGTRKKN